ncbi:MAG: class I SAM-dependent methyltransferase [Dehalococcoidia bacterium]
MTQVAELPESRPVKLGCPVCSSQNVEDLLRFDSVPVFCNVLHESAESASAAPTAAIDLAVCASCSHIFNASFDSNLVAYSAGYENALHHSGTFVGYQDWLVRKLVSDHGLRGQRIVEIGCGQGDFLSALCIAGGNSGVGFDPSYRGDAVLPGVESIQPRYFDSSDAIGTEVVVCRQVLEHIDQPLEFLGDLVDALGPGKLVAFEVPNGEWCFGAGGIWDVIYEHCGYFTAGSLSELLRRCALEIDEVSETFGGQFLLIIARTGTRSNMNDTESARTRQSIDALRVAARNMLQQHNAWRSRVVALDEAQGPTVIWGAGSKGATFLNLVDPGRRTAFAVDLNPKKVGRYVPGTGQRVVSPEQLAGIHPGTVIVMNPNYEDEIRALVRQLGLQQEPVVIVHSSPREVRSP